jgi:DNA-binding NarL/FixJ family response regulator
VIRAFLIASSPGARSAWKTRLKPHRVAIVGNATSLEAAGPQLSDTRARVLLVDIDAQEVDSVLNALEETDLPSDLPTVILGREPTRDELARALRMRARALLARESPAEQVAAAVVAAAHRFVAISPNEIAALTDVVSTTPAVLSEPSEALTPREREVLQMLAAGLANKEIAARLNISEHTAKFHVAAILSKLGAGTRTEAVTIGIQTGLVLL